MGPSIWHRNKDCRDLSNFRESKSPLRHIRQSLEHVIAIDAQTLNSLEAQFKGYVSANYCD